MADNSQKIADLEAIQDEGAQTVSVDGVTVSRDFAEIRRRKRELSTEDADAVRRARRPRCANIDLSGGM